MVGSTFARIAPALSSEPVNLNARGSSAHVTALESEAEITPAISGSRFPVYSGGRRQLVRAYCLLPCAELPLYP